MNDKARQSKGSEVVAFLHTIVIYAWTIAATFVLGSTAVLFSYFSKTGNSVHGVAQLWGRSILWVSGIKVQVDGLEYIDPDRSAIYMSNHQSNFDIPVFFSALPVQFRWLAKAELFKIPIFGRGMHGAGYISIDRSDRKSAVKSLARAAESIRNGKSVLIFPEGTRTSDGNLLPFKSGGFILAIDAGVPIVPMAVHGTFEVMPKHRNIIRRDRVRIVLRPPIDATTYTRHAKNDLMEHVRSAILEAKADTSDGGRRA